MNIEQEDIEIDATIADVKKYEVPNTITGTTDTHAMVNLLEALWPTTRRTTHSAHALQHNPKTYACVPSDRQK